MKKFVLLTFITCAAYTLRALPLPAVKDQIQFGVYAIDINSIKDINPSNNKIVLYNGIRNASDPVNSVCYVLAPATVPSTFSNTTPPTPITTNAVFCLQNSGGCPNVCDIDQLVANSTSQTYENRNQDYVAAGLAAIINNYTSNNVAPAYANQYNALVLNQAYLQTLVANKSVTNLVLIVGVSADGKTLIFTYMGLDVNKKVLNNTIMTDVAPWGYYNAKV